MNPAAQPLLPLWFVVPLATVAMLVVAGHAIAMARAEMPQSRRRIRTANAAVALVLIPVLVIAFGWSSTARPALWALSWAASVWLLAMTVMLAALDSLNSLRLHRAELIETRARLRALRLEAARMIAQHREVAEQREREPVGD
jgi:cytochrome bd-type quinol oxidase subunit 2